MTSMRRHDVASMSLRRHVPAGNLAPLGPPNILHLGPPPQYSKPSYAYVKGIMLAAIYHIVRFRLLILPYILAFYFIPSSEFNACLKQVKVVLSTQKISFFFFTSDEYDLYFFTVANRGYFDNLGLHFFLKKGLEGIVRV